MEERIQ